MTPTDIEQIVAFVRAEGFELKILSGDRLSTVAAIAGRYVAIVGDGFNDVPALNAAPRDRPGGAGAPMARSVADLVLVLGDFGAVPAIGPRAPALLPRPRKPGAAARLAADADVAMRKNTNKGTVESLIRAAAPT